MALGLDLNLMIARGKRWEITDPSAVVTLSWLLAKGIHHHDVVSLAMEGGAEEVWLVGEKRFVVRAPGASFVAVMGRFGMEFKYLQPASGTLTSLQNGAKVRRAVIRELTAGTNLRQPIPIGRGYSFRFHFRNDASPRPAFAERIAGVYYFPSTRSAEEVRDTHAGPRLTQQGIDFSADVPPGRAG